MPVGSGYQHNSSSLVSYVFEVKYFVHSIHDRLALSGSLEELGQWDLERAVIAREIPSRSGTWIARVKLPCYTEFSWKWVVIAREGHVKQALRWEERPNRINRTGICPARLHTAWNGGEELSISLKRKFHHIGIEDTGDEREEEYSLTLADDKSTEYDVTTTQLHTPDVTLSNRNTDSLNHEKIASQEFIRKDLALEKSSNEGKDKTIHEHHENNESSTGLFPYIYRPIVGLYQRVFRFIRTVAGINDRYL